MRAMTLFRRGEFVDGVQKRRGLVVERGNRGARSGLARGPLKKSEHGLREGGKKKRKEKKRNRSPNDK